MVNCLGMRSTLSSVVLLTVMSFFFVLIDACRQNVSFTRFEYDGCGSLDQPLVLPAIQSDFVVLATNCVIGVVTIVRPSDVSIAVSNVNVTVVSSTIIGFVEWKQVSLDKVFLLFSNCTTTTARNTSLPGLLATGGCALVEFCLTQRIVRDITIIVERSNVTVNADVSCGDVAVINGYSNFYEENSQTGFVLRVTDSVVRLLSPLVFADVDFDTGNSSIGPGVIVLTGSAKNGTLPDNLTNVVVEVQRCSVVAQGANNNGVIRIDDLNLKSTRITLHDVDVHLVTRGPFSYLNTRARTTRVLATAQSTAVNTWTSIRNVTATVETVLGNQNPFPVASSVGRVAAFVAELSTGKNYTFEMFNVSMNVTIPQKSGGAFSPVGGQASFCIVGISNATESQNASVEVRNCSLRVNVGTPGCSYRRSIGSVETGAQTSGFLGLLGVAAVTLVAPAVSVRLVVAGCRVFSLLSDPSVCGLSAAESVSSLMIGGVPITFRLSYLFLISVSGVAVVSIDSMMGSVASQAIGPPSIISIVMEELQQSATRDYSRAQNTTVHDFVLSLRDTLVDADWSRFHTVPTSTTGNSILLLRSVVITDSVFVVESPHPSSPIVALMSVVLRRNTTFVLSAVDPDSLLVPQPDRTAGQVRAAKDALAISRFPALGTGLGVVPSVLVVVVDTNTSSTTPFQAGTDGVSIALQSIPTIYLPAAVMLYRSYLFAVTLSLSFVSFNSTAAPSPIATPFAVMSNDSVSRFAPKRVSVRCALVDGSVMSVSRLTGGGGLLPTLRSTVDYQGCAPSLSATLLATASVVPPLPPRFRPHTVLSTTVLLLDYLSSKATHSVPQLQVSLTSLLLLKNCGGGEVSLPGDAIPDNPARLRLEGIASEDEGAGEMVAWTAGAILGNSILVIAWGAVSVVAAAFERQCNEHHRINGCALDDVLRHLRFSVEACRFPGSLVAPLSMLLQPTVSCCVALLVFSSTVRQASSPASIVSAGVVGLAVWSFLPFYWGYAVLWSWRRKTRVFRSVPAAARRGAHRTSLRSSQGTKSTAWISSWVVRTWTTLDAYLLGPRFEWKRTRGQVASDAEASEKQFALIRSAERLLPVVEPFVEPRQWCFLVDLGLSLWGGIIAGVSGGDPSLSPSTCQALLWLLLAAPSIALLLITVTRPFTTRFDFGFTLIMYLLTVAVAAACIVHDDGTAAVVMDIQLYLGLLPLLLLVRGLVLHVRNRALGERLSARSRRSLSPWAAARLPGTSQATVNRPWDASINRLLCSAANVAPTDALHVLIELISSTRPTAGSDTRTSATDPQTYCNSKHSRTSLNSSSMHGVVERGK